MLVISSEFSPSSVIHALCGGIVLGLATIIKLRLNGNTLGVSGIVGGLTKPEQPKGMFINNKIFSSSLFFPTCTSTNRFHWEIIIFIGPTFCWFGVRYYLPRMPWWSSASFISSRLGKHISSFSFWFSCGGWIRYRVWLYEWAWYLRQRPFLQALNGGDLVLHVNRNSSCFNKRILYMDLRWIKKECSWTSQLFNPWLCMRRCNCTNVARSTIVGAPDSWHRCFDWISTAPCRCTRWLRIWNWCTLFSF